MGDVGKLFWIESKQELMGYLHSNLTNSEIKNLMKFSYYFFKREVIDMDFHETFSTWEDKKVIQQFKKMLRINLKTWDNQIQAT